MFGAYDIRSLFLEQPQALVGTNNVYFSLALTGGILGVDTLRMADAKAIDRNLSFDYKVTVRFHAACRIWPANRARRQCAVPCSRESPARLSRKPSLLVLNGMLGRVD